MGEADRRGRWGAVGRISGAKPGISGPVAVTRAGTGTTYVASAPVSLLLSTSKADLGLDPASSPSMAGYRSNIRLTTRRVRPADPTLTPPLPSLTMSARQMNVR